MMKKNKPIRTIEGNDPNLAKAMAAQMGKTAGAQPPTLEDKMNAERQGWMQTQMQKAAAHADRVLNTDEDLPLERHVILLGVCGFFLVFFLWSSFATLDETTRGTGKIIPSQEIQKISSLEGGIIDEMLVSENQPVKKGQLLAKLRNVAASSDLNSNETRMLGLKATIARLQAEADGRPPEFPADVMAKYPQSVSTEMDAYKADKEKIDTQITVLQQQKSQRSQELNELQIKASDIKGQLALAHEERDMVSPLVEKGSAPKMELLQLDRSIKEKETDLNASTSAMPRARSAIAEAEARIQDLQNSAKAQAQTELAAKSQEMAALQKGIVNLQDKSDRNEIKSPVDGYVQQLKVYTVGGVVQPGQDFIEVVPTGDKLVIEARIKPQDIAFLYKDQPAMVKITAYDFSIYGGLKGKVIGISPDAVTDEKGESFYLVKVETDETNLHRKGKVLPIIPGMVATVDILTGQKTVMEYLLKPFVKTITSSMNER